MYPVSACLVGPLIPLPRHREPGQPPWNLTAVFVVGCPEPLPRRGLFDADDVQMKEYPNDHCRHEVGQAELCIDQVDAQKDRRASQVNGVPDVVVRAAIRQTTRESRRLADRHRQNQRAPKMRDGAGNHEAKADDADQIAADVGEARLSRLLVIGPEYKGPEPGEFTEDYVGPWPVRHHLPRLTSNGRTVIRLVMPQITRKPRPARVSHEPRKAYMRAGSRAAFGSASAACANAPNSRTNPGNSLGQIRMPKVMADQ